MGAIPDIDDPRKFDGRQTIVHKQTEICQRIQGNFDTVDLCKFPLMNNNE